MGTDGARIDLVAEGLVEDDGIHPTPEGAERIPDERIVDRSSMAMHGSWTYSFEPEARGPG